MKRKLISNGVSVAIAPRTAPRPNNATTTEWVITLQQGFPIARIWDEGSYYRYILGASPRPGIMPECVDSEARAISFIVNQYLRLSRNPETVNPLENATSAPRSTAYMVGSVSIS